MGGVVPPVDDDVVYLGARLGVLVCPHGIQVGQVLGELAVD